MTYQADAFEALQTLDPGMPREKWVRICFAFKDAGGTLDDWLVWCEQGANFDKLDATATYRNAKPVAGGVTAATLFMEARAAGWKPETRKGNGAAGAASAVPVRPTPKAREPAPPPIDPRPVWEACRPVHVHPYLSRKKIKPHDARVTAAGLLAIAYVNRAREIQTVQTISTDGTKRFLAGARQKGAVAILGEPADAPVVVVAEGFATAAAIEEASGYPALAAGSRGCMPEAAQIARAFAPRARVVIAADRGDLSTPLAAARGVEGFLAVPGPEDSADGFDFADWRIAGATDAEIRARIEHAPPALVEPALAPLSAAVSAPADDPRPSPPPLAVVPADDPAPAAPALYLLDKNGVPIANLENVATWLAAGGAGSFARDTFTGAIIWRGLPLEEVHYGAVTRLVQRGTVERRHAFSRVSVSTVAEAIHQAAETHSFNSCERWLESLKAWDGVERIPTFFSDVCGVSATDYIVGVSRYFWRALVSRMVSPGSQADATVCLVGPQGIGKSRLAREVGGERYGTTSLSHVGERDWCLGLRGKIVVEVAELSGHTRAELETLKAQLTHTADHYRAPYARMAATIPRGCVFIATTNEPEFLIDASGNRRWLPIDCRDPFALDVLRANREQLFAEAFALVRSGLTDGWWTVPGAAEAQADHVALDPGRNCWTRSYATCRATSPSASPPPPRMRY